MLHVPELVHDGLYWRSAVTADDVARVRSLVASTGFFNAAEVEVATGLIADRLTKGLRSGYHFILAERGETLVGYACYGPIHGTRNSFELFWIAVAPEEQGRGLGAEVYARAEAAMAEAGAIRIYADTSSSDRYAGTRDFYQRMGFREGARLPDFYAPGDGKIVFVKAAAAESRLLGQRRPERGAHPNRGRQEPQARPIHLASRTFAERPGRRHRLGAEAARLCLSQRDSHRCLDLFDRQEGLRDTDRRVHHLGEGQAARFERV